MLWIDFKLYFYVRIHKSSQDTPSEHLVVNWFQIVFLREDSQETKLKRITKASCELISNCIFTWGFTRKHIIIIWFFQLWIDFKLYFYVRIHKRVNLETGEFEVVNWFQIVFLREDSQGLISSYYILKCCELISNCIFTWGFTRLTFKFKIMSKLWIDFKLYFYVRIHKVNSAVLSKINTTGFLFELKKYCYPKFIMIDLDGFSVLIYLK